MSATSTNGWLLNHPVQNPATNAMTSSGADRITSVPSARAIALRIVISTTLLESASPDLLQFLAPILDGLYQGNQAIWRDCLNNYLYAGTNLAAIVMHWRRSKPLAADFIKATMEKAISSDDTRAVAQCILYAMENGPGNGVPPNRDFFSPALGHVAAKRDVGWVHEAWFVHNPLPFAQAALWSQPIRRRYSASGMP
jgi:hypothetical protein